MKQGTLIVPWQQNKHNIAVPVVVLTSQAFVILTTNVVVILLFCGSPYKPAVHSEVCNDKVILDVSLNVPGIARIISDCLSCSVLSSLSLFSMSVFTVLCIASPRYWLCSLSMRLSVADRCASVVRISLIVACTEICLFEYISLAWVCAQLSVL